MNRPGFYLWGSSLAMLIAATASVQPIERTNASDDGNTPNVMSIDMDTTGNTATALGPLDQCASVEPGGVVTIDVTLEGMPVWVDDEPMGLIAPPDTGGLTAFGYTFEFPDGFSVAASPEHDLIIGSNVGSVIFNASQPTPDHESPWLTAVLDIGAVNPEGGDGVLTRMAIAVSPHMAVGQYALSVSSNGIGVSDFNFYLPHVTNIANIAVGQECASLVTPPPSGTPTPRPTPTPAIPPLPSPSAEANRAAAVAIDMDIAGNSAVSLGPLDRCASAQPGSEITIDVTVEGIPAWVDGPYIPGEVSVDDNGGIIAFSYLLTYPSGITVKWRPDHDYLLGSYPSSVVADASDPTPDAKSPWVGQAIDSVRNQAESGSGVLTRLTLAISQHMQKGQYILDPFKSGIGVSNGTFWEPNETRFANLAVGQECGTLLSPQPTPRPTPSPSPTPVSVRPSASPTPPTATPAHDVVSSAPTPRVLAVAAPLEGGDANVQAAALPATGVRDGGSRTGQAHFLAMGAFLAVAAAGLVVRRRPR